MTMEKPKIQEVIVVEGRYDKNTLLQVVDASDPEAVRHYETTLEVLGELGAGDVAEGDLVLNAGTREGWSDSDDV